MQAIRKIIRETLELMLVSNSIQESTMKVMKNMQRAPKLGSIYGQDVEAKGSYVLHGHTKIPGWLNGVADLKNPLKIDVDDNTQTKYKIDLADKFGAKGERLTQKLMKAGHDGIITVYPDGGFGEIVLFPNAKVIFEPS